MFWEIFWALGLGLFFISGVVQAVVSKREMSKLLPNDKARTIWKALGLGAASSSCSYAAVTITRSLFRKGADFTAAIAFELASTNMVAELGVVMAILIGWQFTVAKFIGRAARLLGKEGELGVIQTGALADVIAVDGDPLRELGLLQDHGAHISLVMKSREIHTNCTSAKPARMAVPVS